MMSANGVAFHIRATMTENRALSGPSHEMGSYPGIGSSNTVLRKPCSPMNIASQRYPATASGSASDA